MKIGTISFSSIINFRVSDFFCGHHACTSLQEAPLRHISKWTSHFRLVIIFTLLTDEQERKWLKMSSDHDWHWYTVNLGLQHELNGYLVNTDVLPVSWWNPSLYSDVNPVQCGSGLGGVNHAHPVVIINCCCHQMLC